MSKQMSPGKLSAAYRKLQDAQDALTAAAKGFWAYFKARPLDYDMEPFNSAAKNLNAITTAEGAQTSATLALNGLLHLASRVRDLEEENRSLRRRLERLESNAERQSEVSAEQPPAEVTAERAGG
jgi:septum formation inhibitor MinC